MSPRPLPLRPGRRATARGVGLLDGLVAVTLLSFGLLGLARFQTGLLAQSSESNGRMLANQFGDELLNTVLVDTANAGCYTLPEPSGCGSPAAAARAAEWQVRALAALPGEHSVQSALDPDTQRFTVTLQWTGKSSHDQHSVQMATDAR